MPPASVKVFFCDTVPNDSTSKDSVINCNEKSY